MEIRPYRTSDKEALLKIFQLNVPEFFDPGESKDLSLYLDREGETYLTVLVDQRIVGGSGYNFNPTDQSGRINWILFHPDYAGRGLGRKLVEHCLSQLRKDQRVRKLVVRTSQVAYAFFQKFGYAISRTEKDYWGKGLDLVEMEMSL